MSPQRSSSLSRRQFLMPYAKGVSAKRNLLTRARDAWVAQT